MGGRLPSARASPCAAACARKVISLTAIVRGPRGYFGIYYFAAKAVTSRSREPRTPELGDPRAAGGAARPLAPRARAGVTPAGGGGRAIAYRCTTQDGGRVDTTVDSPPVVLRAPATP